MYYFYPEILICVIEVRELKRILYIFLFSGMVSQVLGQNQLTREGSPERRALEIQSIQAPAKRQLTLQRADSLQLATRLI